MSESYREQFPLLCDDLSDEEHYNPHHRQYRHMKYKGRTRSNIKGAVAILKRWPDHWSSFLTYWWIGVIMICLMTFTLYNSLFAFSVLPTAHFKPIETKMPNLNTFRNKYQENSEYPNVYIHMFTNDDKAMDLKKHLYHIEIMANKYSAFNYHLIVVANDTSVDSPEFNAEENNANALNSLWSKDIITKSEATTASNIMIEYISLTKYMDNSPVSKYWRNLSDEIIFFLIRALSIWDKGGISLDLKILTPQSSASNYYKKLENVFKTFGQSKAVNSSYKHSQKSTNMSPHKFKHKVNNIRDVINALEHENNIDFSSDQILAEAESKNVAFVTENLHTTISKTTRIRKSVDKIDINSRLFNDNNSNPEKNNINQGVFSKNDNSTLTMLPLFLEYLYHNNSVTNKDKDLIGKKYLKTDITENKNSTDPTTKNNVTEDEKWLKPMIIPANEVNNGIKDNNFRSVINSPHDNGDQHLTIDIKGKLLATETACHAFLGNIFTDVSHYGYEEKLSDFIINELSIFCSGVLSSCSGIELILL